MIWSFVFVFIQFATLAFLLLTGPIFAKAPILFSLELAGIFLGFWAIISMGIGNFNITPDVKRSGKLVRHGPYAVIRHPMYATLLIITLPLIFEHFTLLRIFVWLVLLVDLVMKLNYEERLLIETLPSYIDYQRESYRLIPFIY